MKRNWFLGDLLTQLFDRPALKGARGDTRSMAELSEALLSAEGEVSGYRLASTLIEQYRAADDADKLAFFEYLNSELEIDAAKLTQLAARYSSDPGTELFIELSRTAEPRRQELLRRLNQPIGATEALVAMRTDLLRAQKSHPDLARTDHDFVHLLRSWFNRGFLVLRQINWDTPARLLDKIVAYEAVHQIDDFDDLRRRLYPTDRRCFAFFHPSMPDEPLIFVEVALTAEVPSSVEALLSDNRPPLDPAEARVAAFYSISNCQKGLSGISFGNLLIKQVVAELSQELPSLTTFVTLSPIPGLNRWLQTQTGDARIGAAAADVLAGTAPPETVRLMAARYLLHARRDDGRPADPVARFHLGNGAEIHEIHAGADTSANGLASSSGAMVNYLYDLARTEQNHGGYALNGSVAAARHLRDLAEAMPAPRAANDPSDTRPTEDIA